MECNKCQKLIPDDALFCPYCGKRLTPAPRTVRRRGNGQGTAFRRNGSWVAQVTLYQYTDEDGKQHRKYKTKGGFPTKKAALEYVPILYGQPSAETPTLLELWERYEKTVPQSRSASMDVARRRIESIIHMQIDKLTTKLLQNVIDENCKSYSTARDAKTLLHQLYRLAMADGYVPTNLASFIVVPQNEEKEPEAFTSEEVQKIWKSYGEGNTFLGYVLLMIYSGMMPAELLACKTDMVDLEKCEIFGCGKKTKKRKKESPIVFASAITPVVENLIANAQDGALCRWTPRWFRIKYYEAISDAGVRPLRPYACRHTTATALAELGVSAPIIQEVMRHMKITTTQKYIHLGSNNAHAGIDRTKDR